MLRLCDWSLTIQWQRWQRAAETRQRLSAWHLLSFHLLWRLLELRELAWVPMSWRGMIRE
jgi:hypothetical protein